MSLLAHAAAVLALRDCVAFAVSVDQSAIFTTFHPSWYAGHNTATYMLFELGLHAVHDSPRTTNGPLKTVSLVSFRSHVRLVVRGPIRARLLPCEAHA